MIYLFCLCFLSLFAEVKLLQNPNQRFNSSDNVANRVVYFFIEKATDGSITVQIEAPPYYPGDLKYINAGFAYIDCDKVVKNYTKAEVANLKIVDINFTIRAFANTSSSNGYNLFAVAYQWFFLLDPKSVHYYQLQQFNNAYGTNPAVGGYVLYSDFLHLKHWVSNSDGVFLTTHTLDNVLLEVPTAATNSTYTFTLRIDFEQFLTVPSAVDPSVLIETPPGIYSSFFYFQMEVLDPNQPFIDTLTNLANVQTTQLSYLYNNIIWMDGFLVGSSALYDPDAAERAVITINRNSLITQYNEILADVTAQWIAFAALPNLSIQSQALITAMQSTIAVFEANKVNF